MFETINFLTQSHLKVTITQYSYLMPEQILSFRAIYARITSEFSQICLNFPTRVYPLYIRRFQVLRQ